MSGAGQPRDGTTGQFRRKPQSPEPRATLQVFHSARGRVICRGVPCFNGDLVPDDLDPMLRAKMLRTGFITEIGVDDYSPPTDAELKHREEVLQRDADAADARDAHAHDLSETPRIAFGDGGGDRSGVALQLELDPLLRKVARKRLTRTGALRRRDALILRVLAQHSGQNFDGVRTDISWGPVFSHDPAALIPGMGV